MLNDDIDILAASYSDNKVGLVISDCACSLDVGAASPYRVEEVAAEMGLVRPPALHLQPVTDVYSLKPVGYSQAALLNQPALSLLNHFAQPQPIDTAAALFPTLPPDILHSKIGQLLNLSLLEPVNGRAIEKPCSLPPETLTAWLHVTNQCNLRCPYCYLHKTPDKMTLETGKQSVEAVIRSALAHGFKRIKLKFAGGEATLNFPLVAKLQAYAEQQAARHHLALESVVLSNGVVITGLMIDFLQAHRMKLMISLDGVGDMHDSHRPLVNGGGSFRQVEKSLDRLIKRDFLPDISVTLSSRNLAGLPQTVAYLLERDLPFSLNFYRENECSVGTADLRYTNRQLIEAMLGMFAVIERDLPRRSLLGAIVDRANLQQAHTRTCGVGQNYLVIDQEGGIAKCHMEIEKPITSVQAQDPLARLNEDKTGLQNLPVEEKEGCRECRWRYWCAGGCPLLTYRATGRYDVKSPNCEIYRAIFPEVLRLEGLRILKYHAGNN